MVKLLTSESDFLVVVYLNRPLLAGVVLAALVLTLVALQATYGTAAEGRGRVIRYTAFVTVGKYPEDDPWDSNANDLFARPGSTESHVLTLTAGSYKSVKLDVTIHPTLDMLTEAKIISVFSFTSATTTTQRLCDTGCGKYYLYIPSRTYNAETLYRWVVTIPGYFSDNLSVSAFPIPKSSKEIYYVIPMSVECGYLSDGQTVYSSSGLSLSKTQTIYSVTQLVDIWRISFGDAWTGRQVVSCSIFTTDGGVLNNVNSRLYSLGQRSITSGRLYFVMVNNVNAVVQSGDVLEVWVYYYAPSSV